MVKKDIQYSRWWRFDAYEIVGGTHIAPKQGATLTYYTPIEESQRTINACLELHDLDLEDKDAILQWCSQYGLLGVLHYRTVSAFLAPRWYNREFSDGIHLQASQYQYTNYRLPHRPLTSQLMVSDLKVKGKEHGALINHPKVLKAFPSSSALITRCTGEKQEQVDIYEAFGRFFPMYEEAMLIERENRRLGFDADLLAIPATFNKELQTLNQTEYPMPHTQAFNEVYAEPLSLFRLYANLIKEGLALIEKAKQCQHFTEFESLISENGFQTRDTIIYNRFRYALSGISPQPIYHTGKEIAWSWVWKTNSLYEALNLMMLTYLTDKGTYLKRCEHLRCQRLFISTDYRSLYHDPKCKKAAQISRYRKSKIPST